MIQDSLIQSSTICSRRPLRVLWPASLVLLAALSACDPGGSASQGDPEVHILSPEDGATVCGDPLRVEVEVEGLTLAEPVDDPEQAEPGTGHVDIMLNGQDADMIWDTTSSIEGVEDGEWQLKVELSNADHTPVEPYTYDLVYITVDAGVCS